MKRKGRLFDRSGSAALQFALLLWPFFALIFAIVDLAHYVVVQQSLTTLTSEVGRAFIVGCGQAAPGKIQCSCVQSGNLPSTTQQQLIAPMLFLNGARPNFTFGVRNPVTITATLSGFQTFLPWWGSIVGGLVAQTSVYVDKPGGACT